METKTAYKSQMQEEILQGLMSAPRTIPSKYFYDDEGSRLFAEIMRMPEYYLTDAETENLWHHHSELTYHFSSGTPKINLVELGAGNGIKTKILVESLLKRDQDFTYVPIDISQKALANLYHKFRKDFPDLKIQPRHQDYESGLNALKSDTGARTVVLFLGSSIGNFSPEESHQFLQMISSNLNPGDLLFIGLDLVKDPEVILKAYNDPAGITAAFNYNLLKRINRELNADFNLDNWRHHPVYDLEQKSAKSYLVATAAETVSFGPGEQEIRFKPWDFIHTEVSQKYDQPMIASLCHANDFESIIEVTDSRDYFLNAIWQKKHTL